MKFNKKEFKLIRFIKSKVKNKKYTAIIRDRETLREYRVHFGDKRYEHYFDKIGMYSHLNHLDKKRRRNFRHRHKRNYDPNTYSPAYFSWRYLW